MNEQDLLAQFGDWAAKLSDEDLRRAIMYLNEECRIRIQRAALKAALLLKVGDWVENLKGSRKLPLGARGHIIAMRADQVQVHFPDHEGLWRMTATLVRKVDGPPPGKGCQPH